MKKQSGKKKEDFLLHELILMHTTNKIKNEKEEEDKKLKIKKSRTKLKELDSLIINLLKNDKENSYTINGVKRNLNYKGRNELIKIELQKLLSKNIIKSHKGKRDYLYYQWNEEIDSSNTLNDPSKNIVNLDEDEQTEIENENKTDEEDNSDLGEPDYSLPLNIK